MAGDITGLHDLARHVLPQLANAYFVEDKTTTIYHFGFSVRDKRLLSVAYRSTDGFEVDELQYGLAVKPPDGIDLQEAWSICEDKGLPDGFIELMKMQKALDDTRPTSERVGIGGEIQYLLVTPKDYSLRTCHRFGDYDQHFKQLAVEHRHERPS